MEIGGGFERSAVNHVPLSPVDFLRRAVEVHPERLAVVAGAREYSYRELGDLAGRIAAALRQAGVKKGDVVSVIAGNCPEMLAMHFAVPMIGGVLNAINTRLDAGTIAYIIGHAESAFLFCEAGFAPLAAEAVRIADRPLPVVTFGQTDHAYPTIDAFAAGLAPDPITLDAIDDEWNPICLNYTSGTTGMPKGVVYHHRGAFLNSIGNVLALGFNAETNYLWVLPMFHCNGWQHPWAITAAGGAHICLERADPAEILRHVESGRVTHFCCAPVVLYMLLEHLRGTQPGMSGQRIRVGTGGAAPTSTLIAGLDAIGIDVVHLYGLTESYGPATLCALPERVALTSEAKADFLRRQGVRHPLNAYVGVLDEEGAEVPADATTLGEIGIRGNTLMAGYYKDPPATEAAFAGGYFHTGDLAVRHPDGQIEIKDRAKDIIISGGENISSLEVENVLHQHPAVTMAAVVALADDKWGEVPCACIELNPGREAPSEYELLEFCRERLPRFKVPRRFVFGELPKTATGKIQKHVIRAGLREAPNP